MSDELELVTALLTKAEMRIASLEAENALYRQNGPAKMYYSLLRKSSETADLLNSITLSDINMKDAKNKEFDRTRALYKDLIDIGLGLTQLKVNAGVTGDEEKDIHKPVIEIMAQKRD